MRTEIESLKNWLEADKGWQFLRELPVNHLGFYQAEFMTPEGEIKVAQAHNNWGRIEMFILGYHKGCGYAGRLGCTSREKKDEFMKKTTNTKRRFKRGTILWNTTTDRCERVTTITGESIGTRLADKNSPIEIHEPSAFKSPSKAEIQAFLGHKGKFKKTALAITDADQTAIALGDKVVVFANSDPRMPQIEAAIKSGNNRSLAQLISDRRTKAEVMKKVRNQLETA